jgi:hypothetical protein
MNSIINYYDNNGNISDLDKCDYLELGLFGNNANNIGSNILISKKSFQITEFKWYLGSSGYPVTYGDKNYKFGRGIKLHNFLFPDTPKGYVVDHINRNRLDNRLNNLRVITQKENSYNRTKNKNSKNEYKGVIEKTNADGITTYTARISKDGKTHKIGGFMTKKEAAEMYDLMAENVFGEYAGKNF